jgi:hypothetical protein
MHYEVPSTSSQVMYNLFMPKWFIFRKSANPHKLCRSVLLEDRTAFNMADLYQQTETEYIPGLINCYTEIYLLLYLTSCPNIWYMIYLTAIGLSPGGSSTAHMYTQTIQRTTQNKQYIEQQQKIHRTTQKIHRTTPKFRKVRAVPRLCGFYPGICLTTEEKARINLSQGSHT